MRETKQTRSYNLKAIFQLAWQDKEAIRCDGEKECTAKQQQIRVGLKKPKPKQKGEQNSKERAKPRR